MLLTTDLFTGDTTTILTELKSLGISTNKLEKATSSTFMPESGKFIGYEVVNPLSKEDKELLDKKETHRPDGSEIENYAHLAVTFENSDKTVQGKISLSRLQMAGYMVNPENIQKDEDGKIINNGLPIVKSAKGTCYLKGEVLNPELSGNQLTVLKQIIGKQFTTVPTILLRTKYVKGGYTDMDDVETEPVNCFRVTITKNKK